MSAHVRVCVDGVRRCWCTCQHMPANIYIQSVVSLVHVSGQRTQGHACAAVRQRADSDGDIDDGMETGKWLQRKLVQEELEFRQKVEFKVHPRYASVARSARGALGMRSRHAHSACMHLSVSAYECTCGDTCREHARS